MNRSRYLSRNTESSRSEDFGLVGWLEQTRVHLPLHSVECRFTAEGNLLAVEMEQLYHQNARAAVNLTYLFPLPAGAAIYLCEIRVGEHLIVARVEEPQEARRLFKEKQAEGRRVAMVESERENLFTLSLGNIQPGDDVRVRLAYFQTLEHDGDRLALRIPVCPGIRYIPGKPLLRSPSGAGTASDTDQVPDASRITPSRVDADHPDTARFLLHGSLAAAIVNEKDLSSPSHPVIIRPGGAQIEITLADKGDVPDRDFVLRWTEPRVRELAPKAWSATRADQTFAIAQLRAPAIPTTTRGPAQDFYILLDRSGSMDGQKWTKACAALVAFARVLSPGHRIWLTLFESNYVDFAEKPLAPVELLGDPAFREIEKVGTTGGTELLPAVEHLIGALDRHSTDRPASLFVITDGEVGNEEEILALLAKRPELRVHVFGVDTTVNDAFLGALARRSRGRCTLLTPDDDIAAAVARLAEKVLRPVLTALRVEGAWETPEPGIPDLHSGEVLDLPLRRDGGTAPIVVTGLLPDGSPHRVEFAPQPTDNAAIPLLWTRARIAHLLQGNRAKEAIQLAKEANLLCKGASFIAWDETERVPVASQEMLQPSITPSCVSCLPSQATLAMQASAPAACMTFIAEDIPLSTPPPRSPEAELRLRAQAKLAQKLRQQIGLSTDRPATLRDRHLFQHLHEAFDGGPHFQNDLGKLLADLFVAWAVRPQPDRPNRIARAGHLAKRLGRLSGWPSVFINLCRDFIMEHLDDTPELAAVADEILDSLTPEDLGATFTAKFPIKETRKAIHSLRLAESTGDEEYLFVIRVRKNEVTFCVPGAEFQGKVKSDADFDVVTPKSFRQAFAVYFREAATRRLPTNELTMTFGEGWLQIGKTRIDELPIVVERQHSD